MTLGMIWHNFGKNYALKDLKAMFGFKPLKVRTALIVSSEDMEPTKFDSMRQATRAIGVGERIIGYARNNGRDYVRKIEGEALRCFR